MRRRQKGSTTLRPISDHDLTAYALGQCDAADGERIERALSTDPRLRERHAHIVDHLARYDALDAPPPPPLSRVTAHLDTARRRAQGTRRIRLAACAAAAIVVVALALHLLTPDPVPGPAPRAGTGIEVTDAGDWIADDEPAEGWLSARARVVLDAGARLTPSPPVRLLAGRAFFEVGRSEDPFEVVTDHGAVRVLGTTFEVDVDGSSLFVAVERGRVQADGHTLTAGEALVEGLVAPPPHEAGSFFRRPTLALTARGTPRAGEAVTLGFTFSNPGRVPFAVAGPDGIRTSLWLEVVDPAGEVHDVPVPGVDVPGGPLPAGQPLHLPAHAKTTFTALVLLPTRDRGAYRCRALYRPEGQPAVVSDALLLEVR